MANEVELIHELTGAERHTVETISKDAGVPVIEVANLYKVVRNQLEDGATITTYIPVVAARNVRMKLKQTQH